MKPLEVWLLVKKYLNLYHHQAVSEKVDVETVEGMPISIIEKSLKALDIIKKKNVDLRELLKGLPHLEKYNKNQFPSNRLTEEEQNLIFEVFIDYKTQSSEVDIAYMMPYVEGRYNGD